VNQGKGGRTRGTAFELHVFGKVDAVQKARAGGAVKRGLYRRDVRGKIGGRLMTHVKETTKAEAEEIENIGTKSSLQRRSAIDGRRWKPKGGGETLGSA